MTGSEYADTSLQVSLYKSVSATILESDVKHLSTPASHVSTCLRDAVDRRCPRTSPADEDGNGISELQALRLSNDGGATFVNAGVDVGQKDLALGSKAYGLYSQLGSGNGDYNYWAIETKFTLTDGKDVASLAGYAEITPVITDPVPEPVSAALMLAGLGLIGCVVRRRA